MLPIHTHPRVQFSFGFVLFLSYICVNTVTILFTLIIRSYCVFFNTYNIDFLLQ